MGQKLTSQRTRPTHCPCLEWPLLSPAIQSCFVLHDLQQHLDFLTPEFSPPQDRLPSHPCPTLVSSEQFPGHSAWRESPGRALWPVRQLLRPRVRLSINPQEVAESPASFSQLYLEGISTGSRAHWGDSCGTTLTGGSVTCGTRLASPLHARSLSSSVP